ncbi:hypothetical protein PCANC_10587 [Puccinia coronata f. sp. avenae]|uniref:RING-type domain-containing protein n=1 Tax=Puccinia coronata f. sp. avenae TaxID=200324 RepID=A0A2N5U5H4_9BASI|nr:hypothetical protein PCASD_20098 [Puccinia coronata f. sp. avenae]PLW52466.1 hypothetical protein PCANC_10587 [Puccinia coronata f. sp. avenae]
MASFFMSFLLFQVAHQSLDGGPSILERVTRSGSFRKPISSIGESFRSAMRPTNRETPKKTVPPLGDCPICLDSLEAKNSFQRVFEKLRVRRWPECRHGYHPKCYRKMVDNESPCALCKVPPPPLSAARKKYLESLRKEHPESPEEDIHAIHRDILQTEIDLADVIPGIIPLGDAALSGAGHDNNDEDLVQAISLSLQDQPHYHSDYVGSASGDAGYDNDDEEIVRALSLSLQQQAYDQSSRFGRASGGARHWENNDEEVAWALSISLRHDLGRAEIGAGHDNNDEQLVRALSLSLRHGPQHQSNHVASASSGARNRNHEGSSFIRPRWKRFKWPRILR